MNLRAPPVFRPDEFPDEDPKLLELITRGFRSINNSLAQVPDRAVVVGSFVSAASGVSTVLVRNPLPQKPQHHTLAIIRDDGADFSAAFSHWLYVGADGLTLKLVGLPASTRINYSLELL